MGMEMYVGKGKTTKLAFILSISQIEAHPAAKAYLAANMRLPNNESEWNDAFALV